MKPEVIVYCSEHCPPCIALKEYLRQLGVPFEAKKPIPGFIFHLPTMMVGEERIEGFNRPMVLQLLTKHNLIPPR